MLKKKKWYSMFECDGRRFFTFTANPGEIQYIMVVDNDGVVKRAFKRVGLHPKEVSVNVAKGLTFPPVKNTLREGLHYVE